MVTIDMEELIPKDHLLRRIKGIIDFKFIYKEAMEYYSTIGRPSIDPVCLMKMLLVRYLYGIRSERRLEEEITLNMAYRRYTPFYVRLILRQHDILYFFPFSSIN
jgi:transposase